MERLGLYPAHLDRTCIDYSLLVCQSLGNSVFGDNSLPGRCMRRDKDTLVALYCIHRQLLERIKSKLVFARRFRRWDMLSDGYVWIARRYSNLMLHLYIC